MAKPRNAPVRQPVPGPPPIPYLPRFPKQYRPAIGLIGCGGISGDHLTAYRNAGLKVVALCDIDRHAAEKRRGEFFPDARVFADYRELLRQDDIEVVDIATHTHLRPNMVAAALDAGKHVLSQKPFVVDLDEGERLEGLAERKGLKLAVNQNGRWAPYFSFARHAVELGYLGSISSVDMAVHWDHTWVAGTPFEDIEDLILFDFAIHWFDIIRCLIPGKSPMRVYASKSRADGQPVRPPLLAQAAVEFEGCQATLAFNGFAPSGHHEAFSICGSAGAVESRGPDSRHQEVTLHIEEHSWTVPLQGKWFPDAFGGTMGELLCSIEEERPTTIDARDNLQSLALCFAAIESARRHQPVVPGTIRRLPGS